MFWDEVTSYLEVSKFVTSVAVAVATVFIRYIYSLLTRDGEKLRIRSASVELIDKVINEREWKKQENRLVVEETFEQLYSSPLSFQEIKLLVYSETPNAAFRTYIKYRPILEFNEKKTKFKFLRGKRPYWLPFGTSIRIPKAIIKGVLAYSAWGIAASYGSVWLLSDQAQKLSIINLSLLWVFDLIFWLLAVIFFVQGLKYQDSEKEILRDLGDKFQLN